MLLRHVLRYTGGNQSQAAAILGITRGCLRSKTRSHGITIRQSVRSETAGADQRRSAAARH
jgi:DNA-binding NtrC family response regulator